MAQHVRKESDHQAAEAINTLSLSDNNGISSESTQSKPIHDIGVASMEGKAQGNVDQVPQQDTLVPSAAPSSAPANAEAVGQQEPSILDASVTTASDEDVMKQEASSSDALQTLVVQDVEPKICHVCCESQFSTQFPSRSPTSTCKHSVEVCRLCLEKSIAEQMDQKMWDQIDCPVCTERMGFFDVKEFANLVTFEKYDRHTLQAFLKSSGHFEECRHEGCSSGQMLHPEKDSYMICVACNQRTCFKCDVPWHGGMTCEEYQASRVQQETMDSQIKASESYIGTQCKLCPSCKAPGKKETGCDHVRCDACKHEYCWGCLADYQKIRDTGNSAHLTVCQWSPDNLPDAPADVVAEAENS